MAITGKILDHVLKKVHEVWSC